MVRVSMAQVYDRIYHERWDDIKVAASGGHQVVRYPYTDFAKDVRKGDMIATESTIRSKWNSAIADGIIIQLGDKKYVSGLIDIHVLEDVLRIPAKKRVCICICISEPKEGEAHD